MTWLGQFQRGSSAALSDGINSLNYHELYEQVSLRRDWLLAIGSKIVALEIENSIEWVLFDLACAEARVVCIPIPVFFTSMQREHALRSAAIELIISSEASEQREATPFAGIYVTYRQARAVALPKHTQKITYTSGSTGQPKGVCLSLRNQLATAQALKDTLKLPNPVHLCIMPLATLLENVAGVYTPLLCNGTVYLPSNEMLGFCGSRLEQPERLLQCISQFQPDTMIIVPELLLLLVNATRHGWVPPRTLQFIAVGGARVSPELLAQAQHCGLPVFQGYGLSECGSVIAINTPHDNRNGAIGKTLSHVTTAILNGELHVRGNNFLGYLNEPQSWYPQSVNTGDIVRQDSDDWLWFDGRRRNQIVSSMGRNISPEWPESELLSDGCLRQAVVLGEDRPHCIAIVSPLVNKPLQAWQHWLNAINQRLPDYAQIKQCLLLDKPMTSHHELVTDNGRPRRAEISAFFADKINDLYLSPNETLRFISVENSL